MEGKYFYSIYTKDDDIIDTFENIGEVLISMYNIDKNNPKYRQKYIELWHTMNSAKNNFIQQKKYRFKIYRYLKNDF